MNVGQPISSVVPTLHGRVLAVLANTTRPLSQTAVAELVKPRASRPGVRKVLEQLVVGGVVLREEQRPVVLYSLNREHLASGAILSLVRMREALVERLQSAFRSWQPEPVAALLFGSAARGDGDAESDIDLLIIRPRLSAAEETRWVAQLGELESHAFMWTGNEINIVDFDAQDVARLWRHRDRFLPLIAEEGIQLAGVRLDLLASTQPLKARS